MSSHPLDAILRPASVAVIGASTDPRKRGHHAVRVLVKGGFQGSVYPVNPGGGVLYDLRVHRDLDELPEAPDLALVCTPAETVPGIVERCGELGVKAAVILAVGFAESDREGEALERRLREAALRTGIRVVGPNTSGVLNLHAGLNLIGVANVPDGGLGLLLQSGNVALSLMIEIGEKEGRGVSACVGVGNEADVGFHEYLEWMAEDPHTRGVAVYAEGIRDRRRFLHSAAQVSRVKPVVVLKGGRSARGRRAARSHTGSVTGADDALRAGLRQAGVMEVARSDELLPVAWTLATQTPTRPGTGVAILSDGGGQGTLAIDAMAEAGLPLADPGTDTRAELRALLGRAAAVGNPVDLAGAADAAPEVFARALEILVADEEVGTVLVVGLFGGYHLRFAEEFAEAEARAARAMIAAGRRAEVGLVVHSMYADRRPEPLRILSREGVPVEGSLDVACRCVGALVRRGSALSRPLWSGDAWERLSAGPESAEAGAVGRAIVDRCREEGRTTLSEPESRRLAGSVGVETVPAILCRSEEETRTAAAGVDGAVAVKVVSPFIPHKTEAGGVVVGVAGPDGAAAAYREILERAEAHLASRGGDVPHEVLVSPVLEEPVAELLVGVRREPGLGPVATVGAGGMVVEVLGDVVDRVLPVDRDEVVGMLDELRIAPLLRGIRGRPGVDRVAVAETV
ncbi:MAG: hypothetical protein GWM92_09720, partial [Gemmatimonadetes bacterium]|nr:hypothetical protein [Gemmatimonadota bacterium]NIR78340.1 hypothetical protein [Gemmatimonadota bacterium]NIT87577.1 hypothetical protein [Gemmatimonadota bacterium]NIU31443.1 hypothetical protein [Gemmatimonadota bacterium]NIU36124.1 hypothetical protein [Gemmatimonadota bacterium]